MTVTPAAPLASGASFTVAVAYNGRPRPIGGDGWIRTHDGTTVFSEPNGAPSWFPCNDHPSDKASYSFTVTVPRRYRAIANGLLDSKQRHAGTTTFAWHEPEPMATYLATVTIGHFRIKPSMVDGLPAWSAVRSGLGRQSQRSLRKLPRIVSFFGDSRFGEPTRSRAPGRSSSPGSPRPRSRTRRGPSISALRSPSSSPTRPRTSGSGTPSRWPSGRTSGSTRGSRPGVSGCGRRGGATPSCGGSSSPISARSLKFFGYRHFWKLPPGAPGPKKLFSAAVYFRGGLTLEALREKVGDAAFYSILRDWVAQHQYGNGTTQQFIALAEADSGARSPTSSTLWLFAPRRPGSGLDRRR